MQQMLMDVAKQLFPAIMCEKVLSPIGMTHSTYEQPLPANFQGDAAAPYQEDGKPVVDGAHAYPEMAAAGLWTTPLTWRSSQSE